MRKAVWVVLTGLALAGSRAQAQDVTYDYDKRADFTRLKTYAWGRNTGLNDELNAQRIVAAVDAQLAVKGLKPAEVGARPDIMVSYQVKFNTTKELSGFATGSGPFGWGGVRSGSARVNEITEGTLVVSIADAAGGAVVWRGSASKAVDAKADPEKREKNITKATEKLFRNYPYKA